MCIVCLVFFDGFKVVLNEILKAEMLKSLNRVDYLRFLSKFISYQMKPCSVI